jgi:DNA helicase HerA-like ATPase
VLYQVVEGVTGTEVLESKNEAGYIIGEAVQLGRWMGAEAKFRKFGWVPEMNTPMFLAGKLEDEPALGAGEVKIGTIPNTNYPILLNLREAVTHHTAVLGVTGTGKSVFARSLLRHVVHQGMKVVCVDLTGEYRDKFKDIAAAGIVSDASWTVINDRLGKLDAELAKFANQQTPALIESYKKDLGNAFYTDIKSFLQDDTKKLGLLELPDVSNSLLSLEYTRWFFKALFLIAKKDKCFGKQVCVALEEAHTVVPESNFIGLNDRSAQSLVHSIGQIALQGRKYGVGFLVIAQRTANVSKTILTQCNTIIAFQQFDKTGSDFLSNYMGPEMAAMMPRLQFRQAVAVGKAFRTNIPVVFEVPEIHEA